MDEQQAAEILCTPNFALADVMDDYITRAEGGQETGAEWAECSQPGYSLPFWMEEDAWEEVQRALVDEAARPDLAGDTNVQAPSELSTMRALEVRMGLMSLSNGSSEYSTGRPLPCTQLPLPPSQVQGGAVAVCKRHNKRPGKRPSKAAREAASPRGRRRTDTRECQKKKLERRNRQQCQDIERLDFSMLASTRPVATGWHGRPPSKNSQDALTAAWKNGTIIDEMKGMHLIPYTFDARGKPQAVAFIDSQGLKFACRTFRVAAIEQQAEALNQAIDSLLEDYIMDANCQAKYERGEREERRPRGGHFDCNLGYYKPYSEKPHLTGWHQKHRQRVDTFLRTPIVQTAINLASSILEEHFPGVARRYRRSQTWHEQNNGITSHFGLFWNMCVNGIFKGRERIFCAPHIDHKNVVGICIVLVYQLKGAKFDHKTRSWLALWEAGLVVEMPPWTMFLYPSSLLHHFNIDIFEFHTDQPLTPGDPFGRGSIVFYNQATMFYGPEAGYHTLEEARSHGHSGQTDFAADIRASFCRQ